MINLDTNVVSDALQLRPRASVAEWLDGQIPSDLHATAITDAELRSGVALLPHGKRRRDLFIAVNAVLSRHFAGRIIPFDSAAAVEFADILETAAPLVARSHNSTRKLRLFAGCVAPSSLHERSPTLRASD